MGRDPGRGRGREGSPSRRGSLRTELHEKLHVRWGSPPGTPRHGRQTGMFSDHLWIIGDSGRHKVLPGMIEAEFRSAGYKFYSLHIAKIIRGWRRDVNNEALRLQASLKKKS